MSDDNRLPLKDYINLFARAARNVAKQVDHYSLDVRPEFIARIEETLAEPDTMQRFLPQGLQLAQSLIKLSWSRNDSESQDKLNNEGVEAITSRLDAAFRLGRVLGVKELEAAHIAVQATRQNEDPSQRHRALGQAATILSDSHVVATVSEEKRLLVAASVVDILDNPALGPTLEIVLQLLDSPTIDPFKKYKAAVRLFDSGTQWDPKQRPFNAEQTQAIGDRLPGIMDAMLAKDAPRAAKQFFEDCWQVYSERGALDPVAGTYLKPKLDEISCYLGYDVERLYRNYETGFGILPTPLVLPDKKQKPLLIIDVDDFIASYDQDAAVRNVAGHSTDSDAERKITELLRTDITFLLQTGTMKDRELYSKLVELVGLQGKYSEFSELFTKQAYRSEPDMEKLVVDLVREHEIALLTNGTSDQNIYFLIQYHGLHLVDADYSSYRTGKLQPEAAAYEQVLQRQRRSPADAVYIGAHPDRVEGARAAGITGVLFTGSRDQLVQSLKEAGVEVPSTPPLLALKAELPSGKKTRHRGRSPE